MRELNTSLFREKFIIHDPTRDPDGTRNYTVAVSNRIVVELKDELGTIDDIFIVRTQNMHSSVRMAARILQSYRQGGPISTRHKPYNWENTWNATVSDYEKTYNKDLWAAVYQNGKPIFKAGNVHPLLDLIEKCASENKSPYEDALQAAEDAFKKNGQVVKLDYDGNIALIANFDEDVAKCGVILRGVSRTTTFNFSITPTNDGPDLHFAQCLSVGAAFLEGLQLAFMLGMNAVKARLDFMGEYAADEKRTRNARKRLAALSAEIANLENSYNVAYRPERPEFERMISQTEEMARRAFMNQDEGDEGDFLS